MRRSWMKQRGARKSLGREDSVQQTGYQELTRWNQRKTMAVLVGIAAVLLAVVTVAGQTLYGEAVRANFMRKNLAPCLQYPFGTDFMGRDMFVRTMAGLSVSIRIGLLTALISALIAFLMGIAAASFGKTADLLVSGLIDLMMGIPHILFLVLISVAMGKGFFGVALGISFTHWMALARVIRSEVLQLKESQYVKAAKKLGHGSLSVALRHMTPHVLPQLLVGLVVTFPHAILHEASITFLGFGLPPEQPAIGIILSESMKYLTMGKWWLALFPGLMLVLVVMLFHFIGDTVSALLEPGSAHR